MPKAGLACHKVKVEAGWERFGNFELHVSLQDSWYFEKPQTNRGESLIFLKFFKIGILK